MKEEFESLEDAQKRLKELISEQKWAFTFEEHGDGRYTVHWYEHKKYIGEDGNEYPDEVWDSQDGAHVFVQDLELTELQTILRNVLRENRELTQVHHLTGGSVDELCDQLTGIIENVKLPGEHVPVESNNNDEWNNPLYHEAPKLIQ